MNVEAARVVLRILQHSARSYDRSGAAVAEIGGNQAERHLRGGRLAVAAGIIHAKPDKGFTAGRAAISRHVGPGFHGMPGQDFT